MNTTQSNSTGKIKDFKISGDWEAQSQRLKEEYPLLTDTDLTLEPGKENELLNRIGARLSKKREEVITIIKKGQQELAEENV